MARAHQGRLLPPHDPRRGAPRRRCIVCRQRRTRPTGLRARSRSARRRSSSSTTASTTRASRTTGDDGRPTSPRSPRTASSRPYIAFASTIEPRKDVPTLVRAFARIAADATRPPARARRRRRLGRAARRATRSRRAASRPASCARATSTTTRWRAFFRRAEVVAYPSLDEGFGMPALEALACGAPLVTTDGLRARGGRRRRRARSSPPDDPTRSPTRSRACSTIPAVAARLRAAGPARAATFTWERSVDAARRRVPRTRIAPARAAPMKALVTGGGGFVGPYLAGALRGVRRRRRVPATAPAGRRSTSPTGPRSQASFDAAPARGRVPPGRAGRTSASRGAIPTGVPARQRRGHRQRARRGARAPASARARGRERGGVRHGRRRRSARSREDAPLRPIDAVRREQDRGVVPRAAGVARVRARRRARARVLAHRSGPVRPVRRARARAPHRRRRARGTRRDPRRLARPGPRPQRRARRRARVPAPRRARRSRARSTTCARDRACRSARSPTGSSPRAGGRSRLAVDPDARAPGRRSPPRRRRREAASPRPAGRPSTRSTRPSPTCSTTPARR